MSLRRQMAEQNIKLTTFMHIKNGTAAAFSGTYNVWRFFFRNRQSSNLAKQLKPPKLPIIKKKEWQQVFI